MFRPGCPTCAKLVISILKKKGIRGIFKFHSSTILIFLRSQSCMFTGSLTFDERAVAGEKDHSDMPSYRSG